MCVSQWQKSRLSELPSTLTALVLRCDDVSVAGWTAEGLCAWSTGARGSWNRNAWCPLPLSPVLIFSFVERISKFLIFSPALYRRRASVDAVVLRELLRYFGISSTRMFLTEPLSCFCLVSSAHTDLNKTSCLLPASDQLFRLISLAWRDSETQSVTERQTDRQTAWDRRQRGRHWETQTNEKFYYSAADSCSAVAVWTEPERRQLTGFSFVASVTAHSAPSLRPTESVVWCQQWLEVKLRPSADELMLNVLRCH